MSGTARSHSRMRRSGDGDLLDRRGIGMGGGEAARLLAQLDRIQHEIDRRAEAPAESPAIPASFDALPPPTPSAPPPGPRLRGGAPTAVERPVEVRMRECLGREGDNAAACLGEHPRTQTYCLACAVWLAVQPWNDAAEVARYWRGPLDEFAAAFAEPVA